MENDFRYIFSLHSINDCIHSFILSLLLMLMFGSNNKKNWFIRIVFAFVVEIGLLFSVCWSSLVSFRFVSIPSNQEYITLRLVFFTFDDDDDDLGINKNNNKTESLLLVEGFFRLE